MLVELRKKNVYTKDYCGRLGDNTDPICGIPDGSYDVVIIAGGFAHGHLNIQVLRQAARALKKGITKCIFSNVSLKSLIGSKAKLKIINSYINLIQVVFLSMQ